jgi:hypothetical protein
MRLIIIIVIIIIIHIINLVIAIISIIIDNLEWVEVNKRREKEEFLSWDKDFIHINNFLLKSSS